jgi:SAM-dependent methyltransferase
MTFMYEYLLEGSHDEAGLELSQLFAGYFLTPVLAAVTDLGIPAALAGRALTSAEVAAELRTDPDATARLLRAGIAARLLARDSVGRYTLTSLGERLRPDVSGLGDTSGFWMVPMVAALAGLADQVRTGRQVDPAVPGGFWDYLGDHPAEVARFSRAMGYVTSRLLVALTEAGYQPPSVSRVVDVGGSRGTLLAWLLKALPSASGVLFDRPESLSGEYLAAVGVADRVSLVPGSFLDSVPEGDLHALSQVLHNWDDDGVRRIAGNCARAARPGGWLVVIDYVLPAESESESEPAVGQLMDMLMMVMFGGRERTVEDHRVLIEPAGYTFSREVPLMSGATDQAPPWRVLEFQRDALPVRGADQRG